LFSVSSDGFDDVVWLEALLLNPDPVIHQFIDEFACALSVLPDDRADLRFQPLKGF
jgi:hypothetical protein